MGLSLKLGEEGWNGPLRLILRGLQVMLVGRGLKAPDSVVRRSARCAGAGEGVTGEDPFETCLSGDPVTV